jgi:hypothetical protein
MDIVIMVPRVHAKGRRVGAGHHSDCVGVRCDRYAKLAFEVGEGAGGGEAIFKAKPLAGLVEMGVDRVLGDRQLTADLFGRQMPVDESEALTLARGQLADGHRCLRLSHHIDVNRQPAWRPVSSTNARVCAMTRRG